MKNIILCLVALIALSITQLPAQDQSDHSPHTLQFVTVEPGVKLEVLDWGGSGPPLIFLAGAGDTAHRFDNFAPQFTAHHHVYGITRRGSGASSAPAPAHGNYSADHLGDDILAVMKALNIERPVLVGHSMAGEELSSIGSRFPDKVSGLIYLDAATEFAFYDPDHPMMEIEMNDIKRRIDEIEAGGVDEQKKLLELETALAKFETVLHQSNAGLVNMPPLPPRSPIGAALNFGVQKYTSIPVPILAIYGCPHNWDRFPANQAARKAALIADDTARCNAWADSFTRGVPTARIVKIPNADHYLYLTNEAQVIAEMNKFLNSLPIPNPCLYRTPPSSLTNRRNPSARAAEFAAFASGASPARINPCPAPSYVTGSYTLPAAFMSITVCGTVAPMRASFPA
jgi:non-heme chloroperoxidase